MSEYGERCQSLHPKVQGDILKCLLSVHNPKIVSLVSQRIDKGTEYHIQEAGNRSFFFLKNYSKLLINQNTWPLISVYQLIG